MNLTISNQYNFLGRFFRLALANTVSYIMEPLAGLISVAFLGHLSDINQLVGVALATVLFNGIYAILSFVRMSTTGITAQAVGRNDREEVLLTGLRNVLIAVGIGLLILVLQYPLREVGFVLLGGTPEAKASAFDYFNARIWAAPAVMINFVLFGWFLAQEMSGKVLLMSFVGNTSNVLLNYLFIVRWDWGSTGAGLSQGITQYLVLLVGLIFLCLQVQWQELKTAAVKVFQKSGFKSAFTLSGNLFVAMIVTIFCFNIFQDLSSNMGTIIFAENTLMMQLVNLNFYLIEAVSLATESLSGQFVGKKANEQLMPVVGVSVATSLLLGLSISLLTVFFPENVFGLLTDHTEVTETIDIYVRWLLPVMGICSIAYIFDGYFLALTEGHTVRNVTLVAMAVGFLPVALGAVYFHSNHLLWFGLSMFMLVKAIMYGVQLPRTFRSDPEEVTLKTESQVTGLN